MSASEKSKDLQRWILGRTLLGFRWRSVSLVTNLGVSLLGVVVTSRLLGPEPVGLFTLASLTISPLTVVTQFGLQAAWVQSLNADESTRREAFTLTLVIGGCSCLVAALLGLWVWRCPAGMVFAVLSTSLIFAGMETILSASANRLLEFGVAVHAGLFSSLANAGLGVCLAWLGMGVWSLVLAQLAGNWVRVAILYRSFPVSISRIRFSRSLMELLRFGGWSTASRLVGDVSASFPGWVIAAQFGDRTLGLYARAKRLAQVPSDILQDLLGALIFPAFARLQQEEDLLRRSYSACFQLVLFVSLPLLVCVSALSDRLVLLILGQQWRESAFPLSVLSCYASLHVLTKITDDVLKAKGIVWQQFQANVAYLLLAGVCVALASQLSFSAVLVAVVVCSWLRFAFFLWYALRSLDVSWRKAASWCWPGLAQAAWAWGTVQAVLQIERLSGMPFWLFLGVCACSISACMLVSIRFAQGEFYRLVRLVAQVGWRNFRSRAVPASSA